MPKSGRVGTGKPQAGAFLFMWISDIRRIQRVNTPELVQTRVPRRLILRVFADS